MSTTTLPAAPVPPVVRTEKPEAKSQETKPTSNWPWVSYVWPKQGDTLVAKIAKFALAIITVPLAAIVDMFYKVYSWLKIKPEAKVPTENNVAASTETNAAAPTNTQPEAEAQTVRRRVGIHLVETGAKLALFALQRKLFNINLPTALFSATVLVGTIAIAIKIFDKAPHQVKLILMSIPAGFMASYYTTNFIAKFAPITKFVSIGPISFVSNLAFGVTSFIGDCIITAAFQA